MTAAVALAGDGRALNARPARREGHIMSRLSPFNSPLLLGFDQLERVLERVAKSAGEGYPPYNIAQIGDDRLRITLAVAGFSEPELNVTVENRQLHIRGSKSEAAESGVVYVYRGIAGRQFHRTFLLAEGIEITGATLENGLLHIDLARPTEPETVRTISITSRRTTRSEDGRLFGDGRAGPQTDEAVAEQFPTRRVIRASTRDRSTS
jgi:HSP20 family molecular chaperone IbpA